MAIEKTCKCRSCHDSGYVRRWKDGSDLYGFYDDGSPKMIEYVVPCPECQGGLYDRAEYNRSLSGVPCQYADQSLKDFDWNIYDADITKPKNRIKSFVENYDAWKDRGMGLYISSKTKGSGKTFLACLTMNELISCYGLRGKFISVSSLIESAKAEDAKGNNLVGILRDTDVLILDDLGAKKSNEWLSDLLFQILDFRVNNKKTTIITSNLNVPELGFDDRIVDRINSCTVSIKLPEISVRAKQAELKKRKLLSELGIA